MGKEILKSEIEDKNNGSIDVSGVASGNYIIEIRSRKGSYTQTISIIR